MIIVRLNGGLGNQLFQYAAARRLAIANATELKLDTSAFAGNELRKYVLDRFSIDERIASPDEIASIRRHRLGATVRRVFRRMPKSPYVQERTFAFDPAILELRGPPLYLEGYFQCEKYFSDVSAAIRREFAVKSAACGANERVLVEIRRSTSVCVHVRRGDYVANPVTSRVHGVCSLDYYAAGIRRMRDRLPDPHFFIFSDDPSWAREHLVIGAPNTIVDVNGADEAHEDLRLMSSCKHHVIANSTFSWWAAWLGGHSDQIVVAPRRWFATNNERARDVCPPTWERM